jgi:DNA-binding transcriptional MerR regulator
MEYSVASLARLSGISVRTLHYYDEIGLLKPLVRMENGRRYYGTAQSIILQEILFFKEIGFNLGKIRSVLREKNLNKSAMITSQKEIVIKKIARLQGLVQSMDKMITYYKESKMTAQELGQQIEGYKKHMQEYERLCVKTFGQEEWDNRKQEFEFRKEDMDKMVNSADNVIHKLMQAMQENFSVSSDEVQTLMQEYCALSIGTPSKESLLSFREEWRKHPELYEPFEKTYPHLLAFIFEAMEPYIARTFPE